MTPPALADVTRPAGGSTQPQGRLTGRQRRICRGLSLRAQRLTGGERKASHCGLGWHTVALPVPGQPAVEALARVRAAERRLGVRSHPGLGSEECQ
eukprot:3459413-Rhodomonas_salina.2